MIQQISIIPAQPSAQPQPAQSQKDGESFQSVMQKTANLLNQNKDNTVSEKKEPEKEKTAEQNTSATDEQAVSSALNIAALAAMLQQIQPAEITQQLTAGNQASAPVQEIAGISSPLVTTSIGLDTMKASSSVPAAKSAASAAIQQISIQSTVPVAAEQQTVLIPLESPASAEQPVPNEAAVLPFTPQQNENSTQQVRTFAASQNIASAQTDVGTSAIQITPSNSSANLESNANLKESVSKPVIQNLDADVTTYSNQAPTSFSDLLQTGNVIIKISDAVTNTAQSVRQQVADKISVNYKAGKPEFQMDLFPKDLGKVTVKLAMENGNLTVEIAAANPKTQSMLLSETSQIRSMIETTINHPVQILQPTQDKQWYQQDQGQSHAQQQQEKQQQNPVYCVDDDSNLGKDDFLTVMQQLRVKAYSV